MPGAIGAFTIPGPFGVPYVLFGANLANTPTFAPIDPNLLMSAQLGFQQAAAASLATAAAFGNQQLGTFQNNWTGAIGIESRISQLIAGAYSTAINKSAKACGGFWSCMWN